MINKISDLKALEKHEETTYKLKKWIIDNKLKEKFDIEYKQSECPGYILLGRFVPTDYLNYSSTILDVFSYFSEYKFFDSFHIEEF